MTASTARKVVVLPLAQERRRHQRVKVNLLGRYMLADRHEYPCQVIDMSPGGIALIAPAGQARGPAHLARQPANPEPAGGPPARPLRAEESARAPHSAERQQCRLPCDDLSQSGAAISIALDLRSPVGVMVTIGKTHARVVRHIEDGFAVEFTRLQHPDFVEETVTGQ